jgi:hypothetical protein
MGQAKKPLSDSIKVKDQKGNTSVFLKIILENSLFMIYQ